MQPDWSTLVPVPWERDLSAVIVDVHDEGRRAARASTRGSSCAGRSSGWPRPASRRCFGVEYELFIFHCGEAGDARAARRPAARPAVGRAASGRPTACGGSRTCASSSPRPTLLLRDYGVAIESWSTELGYGNIECATNAAAAARGGRRRGPLQGRVQGAREAPRAGRELHRQVEHDAVGLVAGTSTSRCCATARNAFAGGEMDTLSETGRHYLGGLIECSRELSAFSTPNVNSYRRPSPELWAPTNASWGWDNRQASVRAITIDQEASRLEYRRPGADLNPYLAIASCLDSGLRGIANKIEPPRGVGRPGVRRRVDPELPGHARRGGRRARQVEAGARVVRRPLHRPLRRLAPRRGRHRARHPERAGAGLRGRALLRDRLMIDLTGKSILLTGRPAASARRRCA